MERLPLNPQQRAFLRNRYTKMLEQFVPIAYDYYHKSNSKQLVIAIENLKPYHDAIFNIFAVFLEDDRYTPNETEAQQLILLLLSISQYISQNGLWKQSLRWGYKLFQRVEQEKWSYDPSLIVHLSKAYNQVGDTQGALKFLDQALALPQVTNNTKVEAILYIGLSNALFALQQYETSLKFALQALEVPQEKIDHSLLAEIWATAFNALIPLQRYADALIAAQNAYSNAVIVGENDPIRLASIMSILALAYTANGQYDKSPQLYETAISFYDSIRDEPSAARCRMMYAVFAIKTQQFDFAKQMLKASLLTYERYEMQNEINDVQILLNQLSPSH